MENSKLSNFQKTRSVILDLLQMIITSDRTQTNPDLWKIHIDNAIERIEMIYKASPPPADSQGGKHD